MANGANVVCLDSPDSNEGVDTRVSSRPGRRRPAVRFGLLALIVVLSVACSNRAADEPPVPAQMVDSGSWYVRNRWPHDGHPYGTEHFVIYSDGASLDARQRLGSMAEEVLADIEGRLAVNPTMFRFPAAQDKIDIYANRFNVPDWGGGARAYYAGMIIWSFDYAVGDQPTDDAHVRLALEHEMVHVVEALLKGRFVGDIPADDPRRMPVWFSEGTAEVTSRGTSHRVVRSVAGMNKLIIQYGRVNPIDFRLDLTGNAYDPVAYAEYYYPMSELAVEYLLDERGLGRAPSDLTAVMVDMGNDVAFDAAFARHMGIGVSEYEEEFWPRMETYLPPTDPWSVAGTIVRTTLVVFVAAAMAFSLLTARRPDAVTDGTVAHRMGVGFVTEIGVIAIASVALVARLLFAIPADEWASGAQLFWGYLLTAAFLAVSITFLSLAVRRRAGGRDGARALPLVVVVAALVVVAVVQAIF